MPSYPTSYPNQDHITIYKELCDTTHPYAKINSIALKDAINNLTPSELTMWLELANRPNQATLWLSNQYFFSGYNMSRATYFRAKAGLIEKGYLVEISPHNYAFYERPQD